MNEVTWKVDVSTSVSEDSPDGGEETTVLAYKDSGDHKPTRYWSAAGPSEAPDVCKVDSLLWVSFVQVFLIG